MKNEGRQKKEQMKKQYIKELPPPKNLYYIFYNKLWGIYFLIPVELPHSGIFVINWLLFNQTEDTKQERQSRSGHSVICSARMGQCDHDLTYHFHLSPMGTLNRFLTNSEANKGLPGFYEIIICWLSRPAAVVKTQVGEYRFAKNSTIGRRGFWVCV